MFKQEYTYYVPERGVSKRALINPEHLRQAAAAIMYENKASMVSFKHGEQTIMVALFENDKLKFFYQHLDSDLWTFIPGALTRLTEDVRDFINPVASMYELSIGQMKAIENFNDALEKLSIMKVGMLYDNQWSKVHFYNETNIEDVDEGSGDVEVDTSRLPSNELGWYCYNESDDRLFATPKN